MLTVVGIHSFFSAVNGERQPFCTYYSNESPQKKRERDGEEELKSFCAKIDLCLIKFALLHAYLALRRFKSIFFVSFCFVCVPSLRNLCKRNHLMGSK